MKHKFHIFLLLFFALTAKSISQTVSGTVTSADGPLPGATVLETNTTNSVATNTDGTFTLQTTGASNSIEVSFMGYQTKVIDVSNRKTGLEIFLESDVTLLSDVVIVGYGTKKKTNVTGSISNISERQVEGKPVTNAYEALQGEASGLIIQQTTSQPGSVPQINIRGISTINGNTPLIIVDGVVGSLNNINPNDIEDISILKDASAAIYGSRAANGVILVTTKRGTEGRPKFIYSTMVGIQEPTNFPKFANSWEYATLRNEALVNSGMAPVFTPEQILAFRENGPNVNWNREIYKNYAMQTSHNLSMNGADNGLNYLLSVGYLDQESMFKGPDYGYQRYNARMNLEKKINDKLKVGGRMSFARNDIKDHAYYTNFIIEPSIRIPPIYNIIDEDGNYTLVSGSNSNPLAQLEQGGYTKAQNDEVLGNFNLEYSPVEGLVFTGVLGGNITSNRTNQFRKSIEFVYPGGGNNQNSVTNNYTRSLYLNTYLTATYKKTFADAHDIELLAAVSSEKFKTEFFGVTGLDIPGNEFGVINNASEIQPGGTFGSGNEWALQSYFGRAGYAYKDKYLVEGILRYDGSSRFSDENRWGVFPSVSAGWVLSEEKFYEGLKNVMPFAKIRASWGQLGNQDINDLYGYQSLVSTSNNVYAFSNGGVSGAYYSVSNRNLTWETSTMKNIGVDLTFFKNNLDVSFDVFENVTEDILLQLPIPATYGLGQPFQNAGSVKNSGWEFSVSYRAKTGEFNHSVRANLSDNQNIVADFKGQEYVNGFDVQTILKEGFPINSYYALWSDGFFNSADEVAQSATPIFATSVKPGDIRYVDRNGDGEISYENDRFIFGNPFPRYTYGFTYAVDWKGWDFSFFIQGVGKRQQWIRGEMVEAFHNNNEGPVFERHLDRWTPTNTDASYPRLTVGSESVNNAARSDFYIFDAHYIRLKNAQIGYTLTGSKMPLAGIDSARFYLTGLNLFTMSPLLDIGVDPENVEANGRAYPVSRVFSLGLNVNF